MLGLTSAQLRASGTGLEPVFLSDNLCAMSIGFLLESEDNAVIWRGPKKNGIIKQFLKDVDWGDLDTLVIDTPPGTSDEHLSIVQLLRESGIDGAVLVTTPQEVALQDVRKEINFCKKVKLPIIGVVENMSSFRCPNCSHESNVFPGRKDVAGSELSGARAMCRDMGVPFLGEIPLDPRIRTSTQLVSCRNRLF